MTTIDDIYEILNVFIGIGEVKNVLAKYKEPWRRYHTKKHIDKMFQLAIDKGYINYRSVFISFLTHKDILEAVERDENLLRQFILTLSIFFHDYVYYPDSKINEKESAYQAVKFFTWLDVYSPLPNVKRKVFDVLKDVIISTRMSRESFLSQLENESVTYDDFTWGLIEQIHELDYNILLEETEPNEALEYENGIAYEYQYVSTKDYKEARLNFLHTLQDVNSDTVNFLTKYVENRRPKVGYYAGSFNPWHVGHQNIFEQAEKVFDKVVIVVARNPMKSVSLDEELEHERKLEAINGINPFREIVSLGKNAFLADLLKERSEHEDVFLIRGIRNATDLSYETNQISIMKDQWDGLKPMFFYTEHENISSSMIRALESIQTGSSKKYIPKPYVFIG